MFKSFNIFSNDFKNYQELINPATFLPAFTRLTKLFIIYDLSYYECEENVAKFN